MSRSRKKVYGRAYPITAREARAYERVDRPRSMKANPIGVTRMASVNGRGSYRRSAKQVSTGKTKAQRLNRARTVVRNGAKMLRNKRKSPKAVRSTAARKIKSSTARKNPAKRSSTTSRRKVPGTNYYKVGSRYQNSSGKFVKASTVSSARKRAAPKRAVSKKKKASTKRPVRRNASVGYSRKSAAGYDRMKRSAAAKKAAATRKRRAAAAARTRGKTKKVGKYTRIRVKDPKTGRKRLSYMYETPKGKRRKIPKKAVVKSGHATSAQVRRGRKKAASRVQKEGTAFVANRSSARQKRAGRRLAAYMAAKRRGSSASAAKKAALRKVPLKTGDTFKGTVKLGRLPKKRTVKRGATAKRGADQITKRFVRNAASKRRRKKTAAKRRKAAPKRRRKTAATRKTAAKRRRTTAAKRRKTTPNRRRRTAAAKRRSRKPKSYSSNRRRRKTAAKRRTRRMSPNRRRRSTRRRTYRRNPKWMTTFRKAFMSGMWVAGGFLSHKITVNLIADPLFDLFQPKEEATSGTFDVNQWKKPITGAGVLALGLPLVNMLVPKRAVELGSGMVVSWLHSLISSMANASNQPNLIRAVGALPERSDWTGRTWPYTASRAAALNGRRRRRGVRGLGAGHKRSIMPRYTPVHGTGNVYQAAAGQYAQAAAGQYQQAAAGEYFNPKGTGEYFAGPSLQGIGAYEGAGQLAMPGDNSVITDGIRPDANLDRVQDIMESAAGMQGVGSYFGPGPGGNVQRVGTQSQWIPNGPVWAPETEVQASQQTSELSAGILNKQGGNGILSGG